MGIRNRSNLDIDGGSYIHEYGSDSRTFVSERNEIEDWSPSPGDMPLFIRHYTCEGGLINGQVERPWRRKYRNFPVTNRGVFPIIDTPFLGRPTNVQVATTVLSRSNPSKPAVDIPAYLGELRDIPGIVKTAGRTIIRQGANTYLKYQFGIKPLVADVIKLLDFQAVVEQQRLKLLKLRDNGGLARRIVVWQDANTNFIGGYPLETQAALISGDVSESVVTELSGHCRWVPDILNPPPSLDAELHELAKVTAYKLYPDLASLWELMPWSWLVDWFSNVGDYLNATRNTVGYTCPGVAVMQHTKKESRVKVFGDTGYSCPDIVATLETKSRAFTTASLSASLPFLTEDQWSILGSLAVSRLKTF